MAKRKRVGQIDTTTILIIGGVAVVGLYFLMQPKAPATTVIKTTTPVSTSAATTAAEIAAGATVTDTLINDLTSDDSDS